MKTLHKWIFLCAALCVSTICNAQDFKPSDKWPYIFENFTPAVIYHSAVNGTSNVDINICVENGSIHYLDKDIILELRTSSITKVEVANKTYVNVNNYMMEVVADTPDGMIVKEVKSKAPDGGVDIGFGMSSSTNAASTLDLTAVTAFGSSLLHAKIAEAATQAQYGNTLPLETKYYFWINGYLTSATKKDFTEAVGKDAANTFLKANKIKWNEPGTMIPAISFIKANRQ